MFPQGYTREMKDAEIKIRVSTELKNLWKKEALRLGVSLSKLILDSVKIDKGTLRVVDGQVKKQDEVGEWKSYFKQ